MTDKRIIYSNDNGGVSVLIPAPSWDGTIEELAIKDVPTGKAYLIVDKKDIPTDRSERNQWQADFSNPDGYGA
tara:strand:- start:4142 stop:4360 length:219 start_codon:yes stop_codon:yes gene_type:complete